MFRMLFPLALASFDSSHRDLIAVKPATVRQPAATAARPSLAGILARLVTPVVLLPVVALAVALLLVVFLPAVFVALLLLLPAVLPLLLVLLGIGATAEVPTAPSVRDAQ